MNAQTRGGTFRFFDQPYLLLFLTALFWGGNAVAGKIGVGEISPSVLTFTRWMLAGCVAAFLARNHLAREWSVIRPRLVYLFVMGAFGFGIFNLLLYSAVHHTTAINVTIEQAATPTMIVLVNFLIFRERIGIGFAIGIALSMIGVIVTAVHGDLSVLASLAVNRGDVLMIVAVTIYAAYSVALRNRPQLHWMSFLAILSLAASAAAFPFMVYEITSGAAVSPSMTGIGVILYTALFPSLFAQIFYARGIELIGANRAGMFFNLVPLLGSALAIVLLGEAPALYHAVGYGLVLAGIVMTQRRN